MIRNQTCEYDRTGFVLVLLLDQITGAATLIVGGPIYFFVLYRIRRQGKQYTPLVEVTRNTIYQQTIKELSYIKWLPIFLTIIDLLAWTTRTISNRLNYSNVYLWSLTNIIFGLQSGVTIMAILNPDTRKMLNWNNFKAAWHRSISCKSEVETYPILKEEYGDSIQVIS